MTQKDMPMEKRLDLAKALGFDPQTDPWLVRDLSSDDEIPAGVLAKVNGLAWDKGVDAIQYCGGLCFVTCKCRPFGEGARARTIEEMREWVTYELKMIGVQWVEGTGRSVAVYCGRIRMPEWDSPTPAAAAFRWLEYPGYETTLHMVDGVGRIVGGVSGRERPTDGIPKWCAWLNPSRHIGYYVGKEQAKAAVEMAAREA